MLFTLYRDEYYGYYDERYWDGGEGDSGSNSDAYDESGA